MVHFSGFLIVVVVFLEKSVANERSSGSNRDECKKDLLFVLDASYSIGRDFDNSIKPFLEEMVKELNVQPLGTQVAMITFSTEEKTKLKLKFSPRSEQNLIEYINTGLDYKKIYGGSTYTGKAMKIAEEQVFPNQSPDNHRGNIEDVAILITDGNPNPSSQKQIAISHAQKLRSRGVRVIGVAVGNAKTTPSLRETLDDIVGDPTLVFESEIENLDGIVSELIEASCIEECECPNITPISLVLTHGSTVTIDWNKHGLPSSSTTCPVTPPTTSQFGPGKHTVMYKYGNQECNIEITVIASDCECPSDTNIVYVKPDTQTCCADWSEPKPTCKNGEQVAKTTLTQDIISGSQLPIGKHSLKYSYKLSNSDIDLKCNVDFDVKVLPCNAEDYDPKKKKCCFGILHDLNNGYECCGSQYYDTSTMQCCFNEYGIVKQKDEACPAVHC